jgi:hypothetical protein
MAAAIAAAKPNALTESIGAEISQNN